MNEIILATEQDIPELMSMIHEIYDAIPIKEWVDVSSRRLDGDEYHHRD